MIRIETLSGQPYDLIYLNDTDIKYSDILNNIKKNIKRPNPELPRIKKKYTMYVKTDIKLFNKGQLINFDDDISFDKNDEVLQISINYEYLCYTLHETYNFTEENRYDKIVDLIKNDGFCINLLKDEEQTEELCKIAIHHNSYALQFVREQTDEICKLAVQQNGYALQFVKDQTEEICKLGVEKNGLGLQYVKEPYFTEEICKLVLKKNWWALKYVKDPTEEICKFAINQNPKALEYVPEHMKHLFM